MIPVMDNMMQVKYRLELILENVAIYEDLSKRIFPALKKYQDVNFK
jgi:hypothetical protein